MHVVLVFVPSFPFWIDAFSMILLFYSSKEVEDGGGGFMMICMVMECFLLGNGNDNARRWHFKVMKRSEAIKGSKLILV